MPASEVPADAVPVSHHAAPPMAPLPQPPAMAPLMTPRGQSPTTIGQGCDTPPPPPDLASPPDVSAEDQDLLRRCLAFDTPAAESLRLRLELLADRAIWERIVVAASTLRILPAVIVRLRARGLVPPAPRQDGGDMLSPARALTLLWNRHEEQRAQQRAGLGAIVALLNAHGIEPILLKGARSLWLEVDPWRTMGDFDILVPGDAALTANTILLHNGYTKLPGTDERPRNHHLEPLYKPGLPALVEVHRRGAKPYAEQFLPTATLAVRSVPQVRAEGRARVMPDVDHVWHGLVHHHFGHSAFVRGTIDLKGLFEFAMGFAGLTPADRIALVALASRDTIGLATLDLWLATAVDVLGLKLPDGFALASDAVALCRKLRLQPPLSGTIAEKLAGYRATLALGWDTDRLRRLQPKPRGGLVGARLQAIRRLLPKLRRG